MAYAMTVALDDPFDDAMVRVRSALADNGFGVVSEIDMRATLKNKLGVEIEPQVILGACNPTFALRALQAEPSIGVLLPCNVVVRRSGAQTWVEAIDPHTMSELTQNPAMKTVADEVGAALGKALASLY